MRKNYDQVRRQKELAKKARQQEKQQRRTAKLTEPEAPAVPAPPQDEPAPVVAPIARAVS